VRNPYPARGAVSSPRVTVVIELREVRDTDIPVFFEQQREPEANRMAAFPARERDALFAHWAKIRTDPTVLVRTILAGGEVAGNIGSFEAGGRRLVGYWIGSAHWGRGIAADALRQFLHVDPTRPLYAHVAKRNVASVRVLEKCLFALCGEEKGVFINGGEAADEFIMKVDS
jgi:RimJ/RimL family protein N-acetyltransferase